MLARPGAAVLDEVHGEEKNICRDPLLALHPSLDLPRAESDGARQGIHASQDLSGAA
jgi:hypothetical protein